MVAFGSIAANTDVNLSGTSVQCRWAAVNPNATVAAPTDLVLTTFTMPFAGVVQMNGFVYCAPGQGATALEITMTADPAPGSTPVPSAAVAGSGGSMPANLYLASFPFAAFWNLGSGVAVTVRIRVGSSAPATMGANVAAMFGQFLITPAGF